MYTTICNHSIYICKDVWCSYLSSVLALESIHKCAISQFTEVDTEHWVGGLTT